MKKDLRSTVYALKLPMLRHKVMQRAEERTTPSLQNSPLPSLDPVSFRDTPVPEYKSMQAEYDDILTSSISGVSIQYCKRTRRYRRGNQSVNF